MADLSKQDIKKLRALANGLNPLVRIGKQGASDQTVQQASQALDDHELVKFTILQNSTEDPKQAAANLAGQLGASVVQVIGSRFTLYRRSKKDGFTKHVL
jgi:RNA-binding protein